MWPTAGSATLAKAPKLRSRGRAEIKFQSPSSDRAALAEAGAWDPQSRVLTITLQGRQSNWCLANYPRPRLADEVGSVVLEMLRRGRLRNLGTVTKLRNLLGSILKNFDTIDVDGKIQCLSDIDVEFVDRLDSRNLSNTHYGRLCAFLQILRAARDFGAPGLHATLLDQQGVNRLSIDSRFPKPRPTPRNPYSEFVKQQITAAAREEIASRIAIFRPVAAAFAQSLDAGSNFTIPELAYHDIGALRRLCGERRSALLAAGEDGMQPPVFA